MRVRPSYFGVDSLGSRAMANAGVLGEGASSSDTVVQWPGLRPPADTRPRAGAVMRDVAVVRTAGPASRAPSAAPVADQDIRRGVSTPNPSMSAKRPRARLSPGPGREWLAHRGDDDAAPGGWGAQTRRRHHRPGLRRAQLATPGAARGRAPRRERDPGGSAFEVRPGQGLLKFRSVTLNQDGEPVQVTVGSLLVQRRPT